MIPNHKIIQASARNHQISRDVLDVPPFPAVCFLELLRFVSAFRNGICALGRLAALPSWSLVHPVRRVNLIARGSSLAGAAYL